MCYSGVGPEQTERHGSLLKSEGSPGLPGHGKFSPSLARTHRRSRGSLSLGERLFHRKSFMAAFAWSDYKLAPVIRRCLCGIHTVHLDGASLWCISVVHPCLTSRLWLVHSDWYTLTVEFQLRHRLLWSLVCQTSQIWLYDLKHLNHII